jgi:hypothetical protein
LAAIPLLFASCEESDLLFILNPDGSGKVTNKEKILASQFGIVGNEALTQEAMTTLADFMLLSKGVDVWENVAYSITGSGDIIVEATALFPDISKLELASTAASPSLVSGLKFDKGDKDRPASIQLRSPILTMPQQGKPEAPDPDEAKIASELKKTRSNWEQGEQNIRASFGKKRSKVTFHLPGEIVSSSNFKREAKNQVALQVSAPQMIDSLEKVIASDELAREILKTGAKIMANEGAPPIKPMTFNQLSFGEAKPIRVEFKADTTVFDYGSAVDKAKANPGALLDGVRRLLDNP